MCTAFCVFSLSVIISFYPPSILKNYINDPRWTARHSTGLGRSLRTNHIAICYSTVPPSIVAADAVSEQAGPTEGQWRCQSRHCRGTRAGRIVQAGPGPAPGIGPDSRTDASRRLPDGSESSRCVDGAAADGAADTRERCLARPTRLTRRQTCRLAATER